MIEKITTYPINKQFYSDLYSILKEKNYVKGEAEVDVTTALSKLKTQKITLTAWLIKIVGEVVHDFPILNTYRKGRKLITFSKVDMVTFVERTMGDQLVPFPFTIRDVHSISLQEIHTKLHQEKKRPAQMEEQLLDNPRLVKLAYRFLPRFIRLAVIRRMVNNPFRLQHTGTVALTSVGMFTSRKLAITNSGATTLVVAVGGTDQRIADINGKLVTREYLQLTFQVDHDVIDGGDAVRIFDNFCTRLENCDFL